MQGKKIFIFGIIIVCAAFLVLKFTGQEQQPCLEYTSSFTENFDNEDYKDGPNCSVANWPPGPVQLNYLGGNFEVTQPAGMGARMYVVAAGDFNGDGRPDLVGLDYNTFELKIVWNNFYDADGDGIDDDNIIFQVDNSKVFDSGLNVGPASITVGDYNKDGLLDFFFYKNANDSFSYSNFVACMYINQGTATDPVFYPRTDSRNLNFTARFQDESIYCNWAANHLHTVDIDKDGDLDILVASQDKIFLINNPGETDWSDISKWDISELRYNLRTGYKAPAPGGYENRGTSAVAAADFDLDGDIDVVAGSVNGWPYLVYYQNDGAGNFTRSEIPIPYSQVTGTVALAVTDFKKDGRPDIFGATDAWCAGNQAHMWIFKNQGLVEVTTTDPETGEPITYKEVTWNFLCLNNCQPIIPPSYDVDICTMLDYDSDGDMDLVVADANHSGDYYLIINQLAPVYALYGQAVSTNVVENLLDPRQYAVTKARIIGLNQGVRGSSDGLKVEFLLSNDGGLHWEPYKTFEGSDIRPWSDSDWHIFNNFGADLRWKAILTAPEDSMAEYTGASYDTPLIRQLTIEFTYVGRQEYSRSSVATSVIDRSGQNRKLILAASFIYPGWEGHLRAYDVTGMTALANTYSNLRTVTSSDPGSETGRWIAEGVELLWDAGALLQERNPNNRVVYTAINPNRPSAGALQRIEFSVNNVSILQGILADTDNDNEGLIQFVRGHDRYWRLGDINHSTPAVVGPPDEDYRLMGDGYADFKEENANRRKVVYVGANDGMLHCFDVSTGEELWAFIPYNQLSMLKDMWPRDLVRNIRYYSRRAYVDSSPSVSDVYINGQWRTVLICGQGEGFGQRPDGYANGATQNYHYYYFALDVTDPENPIPMWEFPGVRLRRQGQNYNMSNGQTWSVPYIGKVTISGSPTWVAFIGSGYTHPSPSDSGFAAYIGNTLAAIKIEDGSVLWSNRITDLDSSRRNLSDNPFPNIYVSLPGSPNGVDIDHDGTVDYVYIGDLDGRLWRVNVSTGSTNNWRMTEIFRDSCLYPIITKPAIWLGFSSTEQNKPRVYFGTGGHEQAPADRNYSFVALLDDPGGKTELEWYLGDVNETGLGSAKNVGSLSTGEKVWADPVIANYIVYFSTLKGNIEAADPCQNLGGEAGRLYARFIQPVLGIPVGGSAFKNAQGQAVDYLALASKARTAVTVGERQRAGGTYKQDVYIQEYNSTIEKLEQPVGALLQIKSWREIYRVVR